MIWITGVIAYFTVGMMIARIWQLRYEKRLEEWDKERVVEFYGLRSNYRARRNANWVVTALNVRLYLWPFVIVMWIICRAAYTLATILVVPRIAYLWLSECGLREAFKREGPTFPSSAFGWVRDD